MKKRTTDSVPIKGKEEKKTRLFQAAGTAREIKWDKLDNTAHLFPVIAGESMSNVYRISVTLAELVDPGLLQKALDIVCPSLTVSISGSDKVFSGIILRKMGNRRRRYGRR